MAGQKFLRVGMRKSFICVSIIVLGLIVLAGSSCNPKQDNHDASPGAGAATQISQLAQDAPDLQPVVDSVCRGDFEQARQTL